MNNKEEVKTVFTATNGFAMPTTVKATPKTEEVHDNCGTPECCGTCEPTRDAEYEEKLRVFFKGKLIK